MLGLMFSCAGCCPLKAPSKPDEVWTPPKWEKTTKARDAVWESIRENDMGSSEALSMVDLIEIALENNPSTRQAWQKARAAQADIKAAESKWYPQGSVEWKAQYAKTITNNSLSGVNQADYTPSAEAQFLLLDLGGRAARVTEAKQTLIEANFLYNQAIQDLLRDVETAYYIYFSAQANLEAAKADVENAKTSLESAEQRFNAGLGVKLDVLQARSDYDNSLYSLEEAKGSVKTSKADLAEVIGFPADTEFEIEFPTEEISTDMTEEDVSRLIEDALKDRPDIAALRAKLRAKAAALAAANSDLWPTLNIGGSADQNEHKYFGSEKDDELNVKRDYGYTAYLSVNWDIFDGFYLFSKRNEAKALLEAERENLRQAELEASADVWTKYYNVKTETKKLKFSRAARDSAQEAYELALTGYNAGIKNILDLLSAQSQLSSARSKVIEARKDQFVAVVELAHAVGTIHLREGKE